MTGPEAPHDAGAPRAQVAFGPYALLELIGQGPTAEVHLAIGRDEHGLTRPFAIKRFVGPGGVRVTSPAFDEVVTRVSQEAKVRPTQHRARVYDATTVQGELVVVREYVEAFELRGLLQRCARRGVPMPLEVSLHVVLSTLRALVEVGVPHGWVSPTNVLLAPNGLVKLGDFGLSAAERELPNWNALREARAAYLSPEHARRQAPDPPGDVFSTGIILWELVAGRRCYRARTPADPSVLTQALNAVIPPLPRRGLRREEQLHDLVERALLRVPARRHGSAEVMLRELEAYAVAADYQPSEDRVATWLREHFAEELTRRAETLQSAVKFFGRGPSARQPSRLDELAIDVDSEFEEAWGALRDEHSARAEDWEDQTGTTRRKPAALPATAPPTSGEGARPGEDPEHTWMECDDELPTGVKRILEAARRGEARPAGAPSRPADVEVTNPYGVNPTAQPVVATAEAVELATEELPPLEPPVALGPQLELPSQVETALPFSTAEAAQPTQPARRPRPAASTIALFVLTALLAAAAAHAWRSGYLR